MAEATFKKEKPKSNKLAFHKKLQFKNSKFKNPKFKKPKSKNPEFKNAKLKNPKFNNKIKRFRRNEEEEEFDKAKLAKYDRGLPPDTKYVTVKMEQKRIHRREKKIEYGLKQSVRSELLLTEESGYLEPDEGEVTSQFTQTDIKKAVDMLSASKRFDLTLDKFGPYRMNFTRNGRFLLLGGQKGHVAAIDWIRKKLLCEMNVMESVFDVAWLHQETLYAVAQKKWVYIYDNQGVEIHCIKKLYDITRMMFLPYHFLLATVSNNNYISWLDVSIGKLVQNYHLRSHGIPSTVAQHPGNAMICVGEPTGVVSFWGPNSKKPAVTKWCHKTPICAVAFDPRGQHFTTAAIDKTIKLWDARNLNGPMQHYLLRSSPHCMSMSHKGTLALGTENLVEVYNDVVIKGTIEKQIYLRHRTTGKIGNMEFCPFEDILGVAHANGYTSMLVPGCGEPNFDALEANPFQTKTQRQEAEVKALLGKIPADLITWDTTELRKIDIPSLEEIIEAKKQVAYLKPPKIHFVQRNKKGKQSGSAKAVQRKKIVQEEFRRNYIKEMKSLNKDERSKTSKPEEEAPSDSVLDRFKPKTKN